MPTTPRAQPVLPIIGNVQRADTGTAAAGIAVIVIGDDDDANTPATAPRIENNTHVATAPGTDS
jgi:hypothetical protein